MLYETFEATVSDVQRKSEFKNIVVEQKLAGVEKVYREKQTQFHEMCRTVDPVMMTEAAQKLNFEIDRRNALIKDLMFQVARVEKGTNDAVRTFEEKLMQCGVPEEEVKLAKLVPTKTSTAPAGLVS